MKFGPTLFAIDDSLRAIELAAEDVPLLQRFFDANPAYFQSVNGRVAQPDEAQQEFDDLPPAGMSYRRIHRIGFVDDARRDPGDAGDSLIGTATVITDFLAQGVGHIGLFIMASELHGRGVAMPVYEALEAWMRSQGSAWLRLGVVVGNDRGERFWRKAGYTPTRERGPVMMGLRQNMVRAMVKPLNGGVMADYLAMVARDRPGAWSN